VRGWIRDPAPQAASGGSSAALAQVLEKSPWLKNYGCALALSSRIKRQSGNADEWRRKLHEFEKQGSSGNLPPECSAMSLSAKPGMEGALGEALGAFIAAERQRKELASMWAGCEDREKLAKAAVAAGTKLANDLETAELSEDVLGSGPLGSLDAGKATRGADRKVVWEKEIGASRKNPKQDYYCGASAQCVTDRLHVHWNRQMGGVFAQARASLLETLASPDGGAGGAAESASLVNKFV